MSSVNKAIIIGRVGKDPEIKNLNGGKTVCNFSVATSEKYKDANGDQKEHTEWHNIVIWGKLAEIAGKYVKKGQLLYLEGKIQTRKWQDKEGNDRYATEVNVGKMTMLGHKQSGGEVIEVEAEEVDDLPF